MVRVEPRRLFFGCALGEDARREIAGALDGVDDALPGLRPVPRENLHLTLRFLGTTSSEDLRRLHTELDSFTPPAAFRVFLGGWGAFARPARATILWVGVEDPEGRLARLGASLESLVRRLGYPPERRPFRPHITVARSREPVDLRPLLGALPAIDRPMDIEGFTLYSSRLGGGPARYETVRYLSITASGVRAERDAG